MDRVRVLIGVAIGLAVTVGMWLLAVGASGFFGRDFNSRSNASSGSCCGRGRLARAGSLVLIGGHGGGKRLGACGFRLIKVLSGSP